MRFPSGPGGDSGWTGFRVRPPAIKERTSAKVFFHSCGNIFPLLGDLIEIGVDILNPVQVSAGEMGDTARLKREFGKKLAFCGAIDTGWALPSGTPADVRAEVRRRIHDLAPGGGYVAGASHDFLLEETPVENVLAMFDAVQEFGAYPIGRSRGLDSTGPQDVL